MDPIPRPPKARPVPRPPGNWRPRPRSPLSYGPIDGHVTREKRPTRRINPSDLARLQEDLIKARQGELPKIGKPFGGFGGTPENPVPPARTPFMDTSRPIMDEALEFNPRPEELPPDLVALRYEWIAHAGHTTLRHMVLTADDELAQEARCLYGIDPVTKTEFDWEDDPRKLAHRQKIQRKNPIDFRKKHKRGSFCSAFTNPAALVLTEAAAWKSSESAEKRSLADKEGFRMYETQLSAKEVLGRNFMDYISGWKSIGSPMHPNGIEKIKFDDHTLITCVYMKSQGYSYWRPYSISPAVAG